MEPQILVEIAQALAWPVALVVVIVFVYLIVRMVSNKDRDLEFNLWEKVRFSTRARINENNTPETETPQRLLAEINSGSSSKNDDNVNCLSPSLR